jgi:hypothetical protein
MHRRIVEFLLLLFAGVIGLTWPVLPFNASGADLIFIPLAISILALAGLRWTWRRPDLAVAIYLLGALPAIAASTDRGESAIELMRELYLAAVYIVIAIAAREGFARTIGKGLALAGAIPAVAGLLFVLAYSLGAGAWPPMGELMQLPYIGNTLRLRAYTATPAMLACVLTAALPLAITFCRERRRAWCAASIVMTAAALFTFSHVLAGLAAAALITAWPSLAPWTRLRRLAVAGVVLVFLAFNFAATISITSVAYGDVGFADPTEYQYAVGQGQARIGGAAITYNVMSYARIKQIAWRAFVGHPVAGVGLDRFHSETTRAYEQGLLTNTYREIDPHSTLLGRLAETGLIGGIALLVLWGAWAMMARETTPATLGYAAAAGIAGLIVAGINADIMNFRFLWVIAGLLRGLQDVASTAEPNASTPLNDHGHAPR